MSKGRDERKGFLLHILRLLMSPVWQLLSMTVSLLSYKGKAYHLHFIPEYVQIISQEIWKVGARRQTVFLYHSHTENRCYKTINLSS